MTISINHLTPIAEHTNLWDDFLPEGHHLKTRHLLPLENAQVPDIENNYVQVFHKDKLIGLVYLQLFKFAHSNLNFDNPSGLQCRAIKFILPKNN